MSRRSALALPAWLATLGLSTALAGAGPSAAARAQGTPDTRLATLAGPTFFVLGTFVAPPFQMSAWRARGVNTIIGVGQGVDGEEHHGTARELGLFQIRSPLEGQLLRDLADASVIAFETDDEPTNLVDGRARDTPERVRAQMGPWLDAARAAGIEKPIFTNHVGDHVLFPGARYGLDLPAYHRLSDWLGTDTYQIAAGRENLLTQDGSTSTYQGHILRIQRTLAPRAALLSFVQTVAFNEGVPVPTPGQLRTQIWSSVVNGAAMLSAFPVRLAPSFEWDGTPPDLAATLAEEFGRIAELERVLIDERLGGTRPGILHPSATEGEAPRPGQLPFPFEGRTVHAPGGDVMILINLSDEHALLPDRTLLPGPVEFGPHEVRVGRVST